MPTQFECESSKRCIAKHLQCDGSVDCEDGTDEMNCKTAVCSYGTCSQICIEKKKGHASCKCALGYSHGTTAASRNDSCLATDAIQILLIASDSEFRFLMPSKTIGGWSIVGYVQTQSNKINMFDIFVAESEIVIFWIDSHNRNVQKFKRNILTDVYMDGRPKRAAIPFATSTEAYDDRPEIEESITILESLESPVAIAVDWISLRVFLVDDRLQRIISSDFEGHKMLTVTETGPRPLDVVVDPESGTLVWSAFERGIFTVKMYGGDRRHIVVTNIEWPKGMTIDHVTKRLYWADFRKGTVETTQLDGSDRHLVKRFTNTAKPNKIDIFEDFLYVTLFDHTILKLNKFGFDSGTTLETRYFQSTDVLVVHPIKQRSTRVNPCRASNCDNSSICVIGSTDPDRSFSCICPDGFYKKIESSGTNIVSCIPHADPGQCSLKCNAGKCQTVEGKSKCVCPPNFNGDRCEHYICSQYCQNNGACVMDTDHKPKCICHEEFTGPRCESKKKKCHCHNGATCNYLAGGIETCTCPPGFTGAACEHCDDLMCDNGGVCRGALLDRNMCECPDGYSGKRCEVWACSGYCQNKGDCDIGIAGPYCKCKPGYGGLQCETDECEGFCANQGVCVIQPGSMKSCKCPPRYMGRHCNIDLCKKPNPPSGKRFLGL